MRCDSPAVLPLGSEGQAPRSPGEARAYTPPAPLPCEGRGGVGAVMEAVGRGVGGGVGASPDAEAVGGRPLATGDGYDPVSCAFA